MPCYTKEVVQEERPAPTEFQTPTKWHLSKEHRSSTENAHAEHHTVPAPEAMQPVTTRPARPAADASSSRKQAQASAQGGQHKGALLCIVSHDIGNLNPMLCMYCVSHKNGAVLVPLLFVPLHPSSDDLSVRHNRRP